MKAMRINLSNLASRRPQSESALLDQALPEYEVASRHSMVVRAPAGVVYQAIHELEPGRAPLARALMILRMVPALVLLGGIIPEVDVPGLKAIGVKGIFLPGTPMQEIIDFINANVRARVS